MKPYSGAILLTLFLSSCFGGKDSKSPLTYDKDIPASNSFIEQDLSINLINTRMGDRHYVYGVAERVFGPNFNASDRAYSYLYNKQAEFGGNCDLYERSLSGFTTGPIYEFRHNHCPGNEWNKTLLGVSTSVREGWRLKFCEETMKYNSTSVTYAFNRAGVNRYTASVSYDEVQKLYQLFNPAETLPTQTFATILQESTNFQSVPQFWESLLLVFCTAPDWQVP